MVVSGLSYSHPGLLAEGWGESVFHIVCLLSGVASFSASPLSLISLSPSSAQGSTGDILCPNNCM